MDTYTQLYLKWITNEDIVYSIWGSAHCSLAAWMGGELGRNGYMYICIAESLYCSPEIITLLLYWLYFNRKLEKEMATHSSILVWEIIWKGEPGRLQSMESQRVGRD